MENMSNQEVAALSIDELRELARIASTNKGEEARQARVILERWMQLRPILAQDLMSTGGLMPGNDSGVLYFNPVIIKGEPKKELKTFPFLALLAVGTGLYFLIRG